MAMRIAIHLLVFALFSCCNASGIHEERAPKTEAPTDSLSKIPKGANDKMVASPSDSLLNDTSTLEAKRAYIIDQLLMENASSAPGYDTLTDLNYDGINDLVIRYYGQAGTGVKNRVKIYLYNSKRSSYILSEQLSDLPNPTFYIKQKKITCFYIGNGGGSGSKLEWINGKWTTTKTFDVENKEEKTLWQIAYPLKNKQEKLVRPFQMVPPAEVLETNISH